MRVIGGICAFQIGSLHLEAAIWPVCSQGVEMGGDGSPSKKGMIQLIMPVLGSYKLHVKCLW